MQAVAGDWRLRAAKITLELFAEASAYSQSTSSSSSSRGVQEEPKDDWLDHYAKVLNEDEEEEDSTAGPVTIVMPLALVEEDDECSLPPVFGHSSHRQHYQSGMVSVQQKTCAAVVDDDAVTATHQAAILSFVIEPMAEGELSLLVGQLNRNRETWKPIAGEPLNKRAKTLPNKKFSCTQYADGYVQWLRAAEELIIQLCKGQGSRFFRMGVDMRGIQTVWQGQNGAPNKQGDDRWILRTPGDDRCMGCRRFFLTVVPENCKELAFRTCECCASSSASASYCVRCWIIQWSLRLPVPQTPAELYSPQLTRVRCTTTKCTATWSLSDLCVLSVNKTV